MSFSDKKEIKCSCGNVFETRVFLSVNLAQTPELKDAILDGRFNVVLCPKCRKNLYIEVPFFYLDLEDDIIIYVYPKNYELEREKYIEEAQINFNIAIKTIENIENENKNYFLQIFFGIEGLIDFLILQEKENDEKDFLNEVANSIGLKIIDLSKSDSRKNNVISKIPFVYRQKKVTIENVVEGLELLIKNYPQLEVYSRLLGKLKEDKSFKENFINLLETRINS